MGTPSHPSMTTTYTWSILRCKAYFLPGTLDQCSLISSQYVCIAFNACTQRGHS